MKRCKIHSWTSSLILALQTFPFTGYLWETQAPTLGFCGPSPSISTLTGATIQAGWAGECGTKVTTVVPMCQWAH